MAYCTVDYSASRAHNALAYQMSTQYRAELFMKLANFLTTHFKRAPTGTDDGTSDGCKLNCTKCGMIIVAALIKQGCCRPQISC